MKILSTGSDLIMQNITKWCKMVLSYFCREGGVPWEYNIDAQKPMQL